MIISSPDRPAIVIYSLLSYLAFKPFSNSATPWQTNKTLVLAAVRFIPDRSHGTDHLVITGAFEVAIHPSPLRLASKRLVIFQSPACPADCLSQEKYIHPSTGDGLRSCGAASLSQRSYESFISYFFIFFSSCICASGQPERPAGYIELNASPHKLPTLLLVHHLCRCSANSTPSRLDPSRCRYRIKYAYQSGRSHANQLWRQRRTKTP